MARRFYASPQTVARDLLATLARMDARRAIVAYSGRVTRAFEREFAGCEVRPWYGATTAAEISFERDGRRYAFRCEKYENPLDNLRAAQLAISLLWRVYEDYGVTREGRDDFALLFGHAALPDPAAPPPPWYETLGIWEDAPSDVIWGAWRRLAKLNHPDRGGDDRTMARINAARDEGLRVAEARPRRPSLYPAHAR